MASKRSKSSNRWLNRQKKDYFVRQAQTGGHVSRAHFKLKQIDERYKIIRSHHSVLELGAAPGGWTNYLQDCLTQGRLIAVDPLPITAAASTYVLCGYAGETEIDTKIEQILAGEGLDLVLSDMAPNISGVRAVDQARAMELADISYAACAKWLKNKGNLVIKAFQGEGLDEWVQDKRQTFAKVGLTKPKASRAESREVFIVATGFNRDALQDE